MRPISSTTPGVFSTTTPSPSRRGCVNAIRRPATKFPRVLCDAKPTTIPSTADDASRPPATTRTWGITSRADRRPTKMIAVVTLRRATRYRVIASGGRSRRAIRLSISRATTTVASMTTPTTVRRCQSGMRLYSTAQRNPLPTRSNPSAGTPRRPSCPPRRRRRRSSQRLAPRESLLEAVPVGDLVLAELPAQQDFLVPAKRREVQEPLLERLDLRPHCVDAFGALRDGSGLTLDRRCSLAQIARLHVAPVPRDADDELGLFSLGGGEVAPVLDHLLHDRPQLHERSVRLFDRKEPRHHATRRRLGGAA